MNNAASELVAGDTLPGTGKVLGVEKRLGWVRVTVLPEEGTPICFDIPVHLVVETERPVVPKTEQDLPWNKKQTTSAKPKQKVNPTPIPVRAFTAPAPAEAAPAEAVGSASTEPSTPSPAKGGRSSRPSSESGAAPAAPPAT